jgi:4-hydroxy-3-polyprenylbenzoate decarboxylase
MQDPDTDLVHFGCYRVVIHDQRTVGLYITPSQAGAMIRKKYWAEQKSCPVAVSMGQDPALFIVAGPYVGHARGLSKYELAGHIRRAPVEVVREKETDLPIPATAEIVIAGEIPPPDVECRKEGPFGEWTGYYAHGARPEPVIRVRALYHRNDPIILGMPPVKYRLGTAQFGIATRALLPKEKLKEAGVEDILGVWPLAIPGVTVVQIRQRYPGHAMKAALAASGDYMGRFVVIVDDDINPRDPEEVLWAMGTRCDPETSVTILRDCPSSALDPRIPPERKERGDFTSSRVIVDACKPYGWIGEFPATNKASANLRQKILQKWQDLFLTNR